MKEYKLDIIVWSAYIFTCILVNNDFYIVKAIINLF